MSPCYCWSSVCLFICLLVSLRGGRKEHLLSPGVCQEPCGMPYMYFMKPKSPLPVTHPLFHVLPGKQKHYHLTEGCHSGCIYRAVRKLNKPQGPTLARTLPSAQRGPGNVFTWPYVFVNFARDILTAVRPLSLSTLTSPLSHIRLCWVALE